jgi:hypothetical protein
MNFARDRLHKVAREVKAKSTSLEAWKLPKNTSSLAPDYIWTNAGKYAARPRAHSMLTISQTKTQFLRKSRHGQLGPSPDTGSVTYLM